MSIPGRSAARGAIAAGALALSASCGGARTDPDPPPPNTPPPPAATTPTVASAPPAAPTAAQDAGAPAPAEPPPECPKGMVHVKKSFCTNMQRTCVKTERDKANNLTICHRFKEGAQKCVGKRIELDFCIDEYEYPNKKGGHPPWMVDWYDAMGSCAALGKRLCYESEWVAACEGPDEKPFPHGWVRDPKKCNIDNKWINPSLKKVYSKDPSVSGPELKRLDQSVPSGSMPECVSDYGVYDLTGNMDEWAHADRDRPTERAVFAALKGGAWGHVRNACRPVTTSHEPEFRYYFVTFRCCKDSATMAKGGDGPPAPRAVVVCLRNSERARVRPPPK